MNPLQAVLRGDRPADLLVRGGRVLLPSGRFRERDVAVVDGHIAGFVEDADDAVGPETTVVDAVGGVVAPGLIDAHTHLDLHQTVENAVHRHLADGTTAFVSEVAAFGPSFGERAVEEVLAATADVPPKVFALLPPQPLFDAYGPPRLDPSEAGDLLALLDRDRVVGVGETTWNRIVGRETPAQVLYDAAHDRGAAVTGHGAGCRGTNLQAFATEVTDDHEAIAPEGVEERIESGVHVIGRYGSIRDDVEAFVAGVDALDVRASLSTDGMWPRELVSEGSMDAVVRRTIEAGVDPVDALQMATRNPAAHFGLADLGTVTPGTAADLVVLSDLESVAVETTIVDGQVVYGPETQPEPPAEPAHEYPDDFYDVVSATTDEGAFRVPADRATDGEVRAIAIEGGLLTAETTVSPARAGDELAADPDTDVLKAALFDRHPEGDGEGFVGFVTGFGFESGAVATTLTWETPGVLAVGADDAAMRRAVAHLEDLGGGWAVVRDGEVVADLATPVAAMAAETPVEETAEAYDRVATAVDGLGATADRPLLSLQTLSFFGVPRLKLAFTGYADTAKLAVRGLAP